MNKLFPRSFPVSNQKNGLEKKSKILLNQIRSIDKRRIIKYYGQTELEIMKEIRSKLQLVLDLENE